MGATAAGSVRVEGLNKALTALQRAGVEVADLKDAMGAVAGEGARLASSFAPSRTGKLRATVRGNKAKAKAIVTVGKARVPYAGAINYGWPKRRIKASMFMQRADRALAPKALRMIDDGIAEAIRKAGL